MILYGDTVSADTDHALAISFLGGSIFAIPIRKDDTEQDTRYILRMKSRG